MELRRELPALLTPLSDGLRVAVADGSGIQYITPRQDLSIRIVTHEPIKFSEKEVNYYAHFIRRFKKSDWSEVGKIGFGEFGEVLGKKDADEFIAHYKEYCPDTRGFVLNQRGKITGFYLYHPINSRSFFGNPKLRESTHKYLTAKGLPCLPRQGDYLELMTVSTEKNPEAVASLTQKVLALANKNHRAVLTHCLMDDSFLYNINLACGFVGISEYDNYPSEDHTSQLMVKVPYTPKSKK